ncbi:Gid12p [Kluyveromyces lactis]|uniref:KLLA0F05819p n=1 Tax=Kluyveromyces lactis (strain ATCC 8585 / CBS 2359 / DSM 70799 / NBRC 1267 / NRRL Y-1140 / WM37) TaxID=284590 RepID=Q6CL45_KLULA|nr:uncharacterized protein KLLA0_F05819g [Kluyveromyces lactis]CAG98052.1 KLLA0F05819p [Kluyveromyces lactis]|eukprot:XP_455344.1 uncharacterized protein KLLA0_F05819g [Kluyveromyces lactis]
MQSNFTFLVSQPSCSKTTPSGYRAFQCKDDRIHPLKVNTKNRAADTNSIIQKFCYLRPRSMPIVPTSKYLHNQEHSDFLLVARNNGIIEIIKDYNFKVTNNVPLRPDFLLFCVPMTSSITTNDTTIVGLEYKDKFLYVCSAVGDIFGFILNLPDDYVQDEEFQASPSYKRYRDSFSWRSDIVQSSDATAAERSLKEITRFRKEHSCGHICYYCYPINEDGFFHETIKQWYPDPVPTFSNCFVTFLRTDVSSFHINPMDRFSVITVAPQTPLTIHKILLPEVYTTFFSEFVKLKDEYFSKKHRRVSEPSSFDFMSRAVHGTAFQEYLKRDRSSFVMEQDVRVWRGMLVCDMVCEFKCSSVWRQKQGNMKDGLHELFFYDKKQEANNRNESDSVARNETVVDLELDSQSFSLLGVSTEILDNHTQHQSNITQTERFLKFLRKQTFPINFQVVKTVSLDGETNSTGYEAATSFLTDTYRDMDVVVVDKFLSVNAFRPKYVDEPLMKLDSIHDYLEVNEEDRDAHVALNNLSSFIKFFMLTDSLCMIWDINGILLVDRFQLRSTRNLLHNDVGAVKVINFRVGIVNDIGLVLNQFKQDGSDYYIEFYSILTTLTGDIALLRGEFKVGQRLGTMKILDSLRTQQSDNFVDQILITNYSLSNKRDAGMVIPEVFKMNKRSKT